MYINEGTPEVYTSFTEEQKMNIAKNIIAIQKKIQDKMLPNNQLGSIYKYNDNTGFDTDRCVLKTAFDLFNTCHTI